MAEAIILPALILGFATGFHCIGMCGPIALSMGFSRMQAAKFYLSNLTYQFGRITTYMLLGLLLGLLGQGIHLAGFQQALSFGAGLLIFITGLLQLFGHDLAHKVPAANKILLNIKLKLSQLLSQSSYRSRYTTGLLNGLLPCGMVYVALTAALATGNYLQSSLYMGFFGLGTLPFMFAVVVFGHLIQDGFRQKILKIMPYFLMLLGLMMLLRALELDIPYLSPAAESLGIEATKKCCH
jgi:uncharacterized protein